MQSVDSPLAGGLLRGHGRLWFLVLLLIAAGALFYVLHDFLGQSELRLIAPAGDARAPVAALYISGDLGLRFGNSPHIVRALSQHGLPVMALSSPAAFGKRRSRDQIDRIIGDAVRATLDRTGAERVVLIGQSFGADMLQTGLANLGPEQRRHVAAVVLMVPGRTVFFRADPSGLTYHGTPDSDGATTASTITWAPLTCIYGLAEPDSLCPSLSGHNVKSIGLPGGHFLNHDYGRAIGTMFDALAPALATGERFSP